MQHVRMYWRRYAMALLLVVSVSVGVVGYSVYTAPTAHADAACGDEPNWWDPAWLSWQSCEIAAGLAGSLQQVESINPLFQTISDTASNISSSVTNTYNRLGSVLSAVQAVPGQITDWLTPHDTDFQPLTDEWHTIRTYEPFVTVDDILTTVSSVQAQWQNVANTSPGGFPLTAPANLTDAVPASPSTAAPVKAAATMAPAATSSGYDFGVLSTGVEMWLWFMAQCGISQSLISGLFDFFIIWQVIGSVLSEFGVNFGNLGPGGGDDVADIPITPAGSAKFVSKRAMNARWR